jgi:hypothetical protein
MYHGGGAAFFADWQEFTGDAAPVVVNSKPRLVLIARTFHGRTHSALEFLIESGVPVDILEVSIYDDAHDRRFLHVESEHEPVLASKPEKDVETDPATKVDGRRITVADLMEGDLLKPGDHLVWDRPRVGVSYGAKVTSNAAIELDEGGTFATPSRAAKHAASIPACDGWYAWKVERPGGLVLLHDLRKQLVAKIQQDVS